MLTLASSALGLVAALAWNNLVQTFVSEYISKRVSVGSGVVSLGVYAVVITVLAVSVSLWLTRLVHRLERRPEPVEDLS